MIITLDMLHAPYGSKSVSFLAIWKHFLASGSFNGRIKLWAIEDDQELPKCKKSWSAHNDIVNQLVVWGDFLASASESDDENVKVWNVQGECVMTLKDHDGTGLVVWNNNLTSISCTGLVSAFDRNGELIARFETSKQLPSYEKLNNPGGGICVWNGILMIGHDSDQISGWSLGSDRQNVLSWFEKSECNCPRQNDLTDSPTTLCVWDEFLVSGHSCGVIKVWDADGYCVRTLEGHEFVVRSVFRFEGALVSLDVSGTVKIWNVDGRCTHSFADPTKGTRAICIAIWKDRLVTGTCDGIEMQTMH